MKPVILFFLLLSSGFVLQAQPSAPPPVSPTPTLDELTNLFRSALSGRLDLLNAVSMVAEKGDSAIAGLSEVIFTSSQSSDTLRTVRIYSLLALEAIGSSDAFSLMHLVAENHDDPEIRGVALNSLATTYHERLMANQWTPNREIIHLFLRDAGDSTRVDFIEKEKAIIAHTGLENWLGRNPWEKRTGRIRVRNGEESVIMTMDEYREFWWQQNKERLHWNEPEGRFEL